MWRTISWKKPSRWWWT